MAKVSNQGQPEKQILDQTRFLWKKLTKKIDPVQQPTSCHKKPVVRLRRELLVDYLRIPLDYQVHFPCTLPKAGIACFGFYQIWALFSGLRYILCFSVTPKLV